MLRVERDEGVALGVDDLEIVLATALGMVAATQRVLPFSVGVLNCVGKSCSKPEVPVVWAVLNCRKVGAAVGLDASSAPASGVLGTPLTVHCWLGLPLQP